MEFEPISDWSTVVIGYWNRAILTPSGIGKKLFGIEAGTALDVQVALDQMVPHRVERNGIAVQVFADRLIVGADAMTFRQLQSSNQIAARAMTELPETPVSAAGFNIRYVADRDCDELREILKHESDERLSDNSFEIVQHVHKRSLEWHGGRINLSIFDVGSNSDRHYRVDFNFEMKSSDREQLCIWLDRPIEEAEAVVRTLTESYLQLEYVANADAE